MSGEPVTYAWAVLFPTKAGWGSPGAPLVGTIHATRELSMKDFVSWWRSGADANLTVSTIWQRAYRRGWRLARVSITPTHGY